MRQKILLFSLALAVTLHAVSQMVVDTLILDNSKMGFGLLIRKTTEDYKSRLYRKFYTVGTKPALISCTKNGQGDISAKVFLNSDWVTIVSTGITAENNHEYQWISTDSLLSDNKPISEATWSGTFIEEVYNGKRMTMLSFGATDNSINKYMIRETKTGKNVAQMTVQFISPEPVPLFMSIDSIMIDNADIRPSDNISFDTTQMIVSKETIANVNLTETQYDSNGYFGLPKKLVLPTENNSLLIYFRKASVYPQRTMGFLEYKLHDQDTIWRTTPKSDFPCILLKNLKTGKYQLNVRHPNQAEEIFRYEFEIRPRFTETTTFKVLTGSAITALFCGSLFYIKHRQQQQKIKSETVKRKMLAAELNSLRSQLNPHFIFNALSSIQGLFNANEAAKANLYLSDFSSLLRQTLINNDKEFVPIQQEIAMLETYIKLEQLRFNFQYGIHMDDNIVNSNDEIPFLLAQPIVENAIKHGISGIGQNGTIALNIFRQQNKLCLQIEDNGKGYNLSQNNTNGFGLKLTADRIKLLNETNPDIKITMQTDSEIGKGTSVLITYEAIA